MSDRIVTGPPSERPAYGAMFSIDAVKRANRESGSHFFDTDTLRFFGSRVLSGTYGGRFFITSERTGFDHNAPRAYTVREFMPDASIETVGEFNAYASGATARAAARRATQERHAYYFEGQHGRNGRRRTYIVTADDPWAAMDRLHKNFRVWHVGRAADYMLTDTGTYPRLEA